jgi:hypothetical protein
MFMIMRMDVLLPAPLGPISPKISPGRAVSDIPSTAVTESKRLTTFRTSTIVLPFSMAVFLEIYRIAAAGGKELFSLARRPSLP